MLLDTLKADLGVAMKGGDKDRTTCLRLVISAAKYKEVALKKVLDDSEILQVIRTQIKQSAESHEQYKIGGRDDLADKEEKNLAILKSYLPQELGEDEVAAIVRQIISEQGATKKDFGKVMKLVMAKLSGQAEGKMVSSIVSRLLQ
ncbi:MAG TPA: GatB/YqeY domain-containing protein [Deltaproteobacteria bacterium]|nr:GatB/YqeY domain-containing protein [Deltaproteobacteria bacterium]